MIYEFTASNQHWYVDTDKTYIKITDHVTNTVTESFRLGLFGQLEGRRVSAYEGTYAMIGVSSPIKQEYHFIQGEGNRIIWMEDGKKKNK